MRARGTLPRFALVACTLLALGAFDARHASADEPTFDSANAAFADARFDEARDAFARLATRDGASAAILYNLGNAAFRAGKPGEAILAYERALLIAPRDQDVRANLRQVRKAVGLPEPEDGLWTRVVGSIGTNGWAWLASGGLWLACAALLARRLAGGDGGARPLRSALVATAGTGVAILMVAGAACATRLGERDRGVVLDGDPKLRVAPYASATVSSELPPGEIVRIERTHEGFTLVRTAAGRSGWMPDASVGRIAAP